MVDVSLTIQLAGRDQARVLAALHSVDLGARIAPRMLGLDRPQRYFVAFQNNAEARGTGGLPGAFGILGTAQLGNDPPYVLKLHSAMNPVRDLTIDLDFRAYGALRQSTVPAYQELGGRIAWQATPDVTLSVQGTNLLPGRHQEYPQGDLIPSRVLGSVELRF